MNRRDFNLFLPSLAALAVQPKPSEPEPLIFKRPFHKTATIGHWLQTFCEFQYHPWFPTGSKPAQLGIAKIEPPHAVPQVQYPRYYQGEIVAVRYKSDFSEGCPDLYCSCHEPFDIVLAIGETDKSVAAKLHQMESEPCDQCGYHASAYLVRNPCRYLCYRCYMK